MLNIIILLNFVKIIIIKKKLLHSKLYYQINDNNSIKFEEEKKNISFKNDNY
jgi:hypothetical protein